jgi:hypothetical protein
MSASGKIARRSGALRPMPQPKSRTASTRPTQLLREFDLVAGEKVAVAVEELRLRGEDRLVLSGVLVELDARHETVL